MRSPREAPWSALARAPGLPRPAARVLALGLAGALVACGGEGSPISSSIPQLRELPELVPADVPPASRVTIRMGDVAYRTKGARVTARRVEAVLRVPRSSAARALDAVRLEIDRPTVTLPPARPEHGGGGSAAPGAAEGAAIRRRVAASDRGRTALDRAAAAIAELDLPRFDPSLLFRPLTSLPVTIERLRVRGGIVSRPASRVAARPSGWSVEGIEVEGRDIRLGPAPDRRFRLTASAASLEAGGRPLPLREMRATTTLQNGRLDANAVAALAASRASIDARATRAAGWSATLRADTFTLADLRSIDPRLATARGSRVARGSRAARDSLVAHGATRRAGVSGSLLAHAAGSADSTRVTVDRLALATDSSAVRVEGAAVQRAAGGVFLDDLTVALAPLAGADLRAFAGRGLPRGGCLTGGVRAAGPLRGDVRVVGEVWESPSADSAAPSRLDLAGTIHLAEQARVDLRIAADPLHVADTAFAVALSAAGPLDAVRLDGRAGLLRAAPARTARRATTLGPRSAGSDAAAIPFDGVAADVRPPESPAAIAARTRFAAAIQGTVGLAAKAPLDVGVRLDSLPAAALVEMAMPPRQVERVEGGVSGEARVSGTLSKPRLGARVAIRGVGAYVVPAGIHIHDVDGRLTLSDGEIRVDTLAGRVGEGRFALSGGASLAGARTLALHLRADSVPAIARDSTRVVLSADVAVAGTVKRPRVSGRAVVLSGRVHEDTFKPSTTIDLQDPPYAALAARAPWIGHSRLLRASPDTASPLPLDLDLELGIHSDFKIWDEDSLTGSEGAIHLTTEPDGLHVVGTAAVVDGFYEFYGKRFDVVGGAFDFPPGGGLEPRVAILATYDVPPSLGRDAAAVVAEADYPPVQFLARGTGHDEEQEIRWPTLLPRTRAERGAFLLYGDDPGPVTGWRPDAFYLPAAPAGFVDGRSENQLVNLFWSYAADEGYDYIPIDYGVLRGGWIRVGSHYPAPFVVGPMMRGSVRLGDAGWLLVSEPLQGDAAPGLRLRHRAAGGEIDLFDEPRFFAAPIAGVGDAGFFTRRRYGMGVRWQWNF